MTLPYSKPFYITNEVSNNAFSFQQRQQKQLYVPALVAGTVADAAIGEETVFEEIDDDGSLKTCRGLKQFIKTTVEKVPTYIFDNHNHAFAFWIMEWHNGNLQEGTTLVHIDQHKDTRRPATYLSRQEAQDIQKVFHYTNTVLNVGNFIPPAQHCGLVDNLIIIDSQASMESFQLQKTLAEAKSIILDVDLDFFAPDMDYIDAERKIACIRQLLPYAHTITFATSPFFIEQERALHYLERITTDAP